MLVGSDTLRKALVTLSTVHASCQYLQPIQPHEVPQITNTATRWTARQDIKFSTHSYILQNSWN